jgi:L-aspartate-alpha-decarboxylase
MQRTMLKSKIHRATVTHCELYLEGSSAIDEDLLEAVNLVGNEQIDIWTVNNGERLRTCAVKGNRGSGMFSLNGSAARWMQLGNLDIEPSLVGFEACHGFHFWTRKSTSLGQAVRLLSTQYVKPFLVVGRTMQVTRRLSGLRYRGRASRRADQGCRAAVGAISSSYAEVAHSRAEIEIEADETHVCRRGFHLSGGAL